MRIRVKFSKTGAMKYIGHLDVMRFFQKALRRADIPYALSGGFSPHMQMSFAAPLGVGKTTTGDYFDLDLSADMPAPEIGRRLNEQMTEGFSVLEVCEISEDKASKGMSQVAAADYTVFFADNEGFAEDCIRRYLDQPQILVMRKTKRREEMTDIRPWILSLSADEGAVHMRLSAGSVQNLKPELVVESLAEFTGKKISPFSFRINRDDILAAVKDGTGDRYVPLGAVGVHRV